MSRLVVTVRCLYEEDRPVETFEGTHVAVRAALLMRFPFLRSEYTVDDTVEQLIEHLDRLQAFQVDLTGGVSGT